MIINISVIMKVYSLLYIKVYFLLYKVMYDDNIYLLLYKRVCVYRQPTFYIIQNNVFLVMRDDV